MSPYKGVQQDEQLFKALARIAELRLDSLCVQNLAKTTEVLAAVDEQDVRKALDEFNAQELANTALAVAVVIQ